MTDHDVYVVEQTIRARKTEKVLCHPEDASLVPAYFVGGGATLLNKLGVDIIK